jgi:hypothetical protein
MSAGEFTGNGREPGGPRRLLCSESHVVAITFSHILVMTGRRERIVVLIYGNRPFSRSNLNRRNGLWHCLRVLETIFALPSLAGWAELGVENALALPQSAYWPAFFALNLFPLVLLASAANRERFIEVRDVFRRFIRGKTIRLQCTASFRGAALD